MSDAPSQPSGWSLVSLGDVGRLHCGQSPSVANVIRVGKGMPYVTGPDHWDGSVLTADKWTTDPRRIVPDGCIFITVKGAGVGTLFPGIACAIGRDVYAYEPGKGLSAKFVEHALRYQIGEVLRHAKGDIPGLSKEHILGHRMAIPSTQEQRRIVAKIEELFSDLDAGVAALERVKTNLKRYRAAVLKAAVGGRLTEEWRKRHPDTEPAATLLERILAERRTKWEQDQLRKFKKAGKTPPKGWKEKYEEPAQERTIELGALPHGWCSAQIGTIADTSTGGTPSRARAEYFGGDVPWVKSGELGDSVVSHSEETISESGLNNSSAKVFPAGTLCIALYGATVGKVGILGIPAATNQAVCAMFLPPGINTRFAFYYLISIRSKLVALGKGGAQPNISNGIVRATELPIPPVAEQAEIVAEVDRRLSVADAAETQVEHARQRAARLRLAILKLAFEGKLVPQDPADEPATEFLHRIETTMAKKRKPRKAQPSGIAPPTRGALGEPSNPGEGFPKAFVTNVLARSPGVRLVAMKYTGGFRSLPPLDLSLRSTNDQEDSASPLCLVGLNGSGKSNLIELIGLLFCDIELSLIDYTRVPLSRRALKHPPFSITYELRSSNEQYAVITLVRATGEPLRAIVAYQDTEFTTTAPEELRRLLPTWIIAYSSGLNETISLPFMRNRAYYSEEVSNHAGKADGAAPVRDIRTVFLDYECNAAILVSNYVFQQDARAHLFREALRIRQVTSFAFSYRLKRPKGGTTVRLTRELSGILARLRDAATSIEERREVHGATLHFDLENGAGSALRKRFADAADFFQSIHKWALLNSLSLSGSERRVYLQQDAGSALLAQPPTVSRDDQIFRIDDLQLRLITPDRIIPYAGLSDGEHQFIQVFGSILLFDRPGTLFLLDEPETHFNPQWRRKFVEYLNRVNSTRAQEFVVSTHSPFVVSGCRGSGVFIFRRQDSDIVVHSVDFETFGSSYEMLLRKLFDLETTIAEQAANEMREVLRSNDPRLIENAAGRFGESWEKQLIYRRLADLEQEQKPA